jgi:anti-sigma factor RsiW
MKCDEVRGNLAAYLDGEIEGASRRAMDAHLSDCPACLAEKRAQAAAWRLLDMAGDVPAAPAGQRERILAAARKSPGGRVLRLPFRAVAAGGAALYLGRDGAAPASSPPDQLLENLAVLESLDLLQDDDVTMAESLSEYPVDDLETLGG